MQSTQMQIDHDSFRALLGNYPTGVAVITGLDPRGEPLGMVVGTFTSVSLNPPLVAFLPMKTSRSFTALREASDRFCVNILAADQEGVCRKLAAPGERKFDAVPWRLSPEGNPIIQGVVGWIDCEFANIVDGGDHYIVLGAVKSMGLERDALPLLFFQRGYGRFSQGPLSAADERQLLRSVRLAEVAREEIEAIAAELSVGCSVIAPAGSDAVYVAVADSSASSQGKDRLGVRAPMAPPLGALLVDSPNSISEELWLARLGKNAEAVEKAREQLARVRERGWSISLMGSLSPAELEEAIDTYSCPQRTPEQERRFFSTVLSMFDMHEPAELNEGDRYDVMHLSVPVKRADGTTALVMRLSELPPQMQGADIKRILSRLQSAAANVEVLIRGHLANS